jgi:membrane-associated phospholipid phosphatase
VLPFAGWLVLLAVLNRRGVRVVGLVRATLWALVVSFILAHVNRWFLLWHRDPNFPSGHETFASCLWTAVVLIDRRFIIAALPLLALLAYVLVRAGWHGRLDVLGGFLLGTIAMVTFGEPYLRLFASTDSSHR